MLNIRLVMCFSCGRQYSAENDACTYCGVAPYISRELRESIEYAASLPKVYTAGETDFSIDETISVASIKLSKTAQKGKFAQNNNRLRFFVPVNPMPKERPRFGGGKPHTSQKTKDYEAVVKHYASVAIAEQGYIVPDKHAPLMAILHFYRKDKIGVDSDNLQKAIFDALNKLAFPDDKQILASIVTLERGTRHTVGASVEIRPYYPKLSIIENLEAGRE